MNKIKWVSKEVAVDKIKPTPKNYKIKNDLGRQRLQASLKSFGLAGNVVVNTDYTLIDGNSRLEEAIENKEKKMWVSMPNRKLTSKEFVEMSAMFDFAKAGDVDIEAIQRDLGTTESFFKKYHMEIPMHLLDNMGKKSRANVLDFEDLQQSAEELKPQSQFRMVQLFLSSKQEDQFRKWEDQLMKKFKTDSTTETVYEALKLLAKNLKLK